MRIAALAIAFLVLAAAGCARFPQNPALKTYDPHAGYRFEKLALNEGNTDDTFVILTLSGGGTRAAGFAYGAIRELSKTKLDDSNRTLLDEVDVISSVSGGSFAAGYYGVFGQEAFLRDFPEAVLYRKIERDLILRILAPWNWPRLLSWWYGRGDLADRYYDHEIFKKAHYANLPRYRPLIQLNATDISIGARFSFVQGHFDRLCSNLDGVSVSRGVTASSAFPVAFTPLTLENYPSHQCDYPTPEWVETALDELELNSPRFDRAKRWKSYENPKRRFIHVNDGGLADNIGLRGPILSLITPYSDIELMRRINDRERPVKRVVMIIVDAKPEGEPKIDASARPPGIFTVLNAAATKPMENYSADTVQMADLWIDRWKVEVSAARRILGPDADIGPEPEFYAIHVRFEAERDCVEKNELNKMGTRLQLSRVDVDRVVAAGARLLRQSPNYGRLLGDLEAPDAPEAPEEALDEGCTE